MGKIDDHIGFQAAIGRIGVNRKARMALGIEIEPRDDGTVAPFGGAAGDDTPHFAVASAENQTNHIGLPFC
jgi:hypothetical protein